MNECALDLLGLLLLGVGMRFGQPRFLRVLCLIALGYYAIFAASCFLWLRAQLHDFTTHSQTLHVGISAAFAFEGFWQLYANMVLLDAVMPMAVAFTAFYAVRWLASPRRGSSFS